VATERSTLAAPIQQPARCTRTVLDTETLERLITGGKALDEEALHALTLETGRVRTTSWALSTVVVFVEGPLSGVHPRGM